MNYKTYAPHESLSAFVKCYWTLDGPKANNPEKQRIVPDGCMEMIFHYGDLYKQYVEDGSTILQPPCFVFGQITHALDIEPTGETGIFAIRFHPEGFTPFVTLPVKDLENRAVPLYELFSDEGRRLEKEVLSASTHADRIKTIESFLLNRLISSESIDRVAQTSVELLMQLNGQVSVNELAEDLQIKRRQLERKFSSVIGLSPKQLAKMIRIQATLKMLANKRITSLTAIAYEGHYYDQAHFIKDFKEFTGLSPKEFYANNLKMSLLFAETE
jgi:AraC-like DNA-binding protein